MSFAMIGGGQRLGDAVGDGEAGLAVQHARGVLDGGLGLDRAERDDLRDVLLAPLVHRVAHHLAAPTLVEVEVDVGGAHALGVEEALEQQAVLDGVEVGDLEDVGQQRPGGRATARPDRDLLLLGPAHEVADHEEVAGEAHLRDDPQLELDAVLVLRLEAVGEAVWRVLLDLGAQQVVLGLARREREARHPVDLGEHRLVGLDALGDQQGVVGCAGHLGIPVLAHFARRCAGNSRRRRT